MEPEDETIGILVDKPVEHEVAPEEEVEEDGDVKAEDEEEQIEQSAAEPGALTDEEMVEADDENIIEDEHMKDEEEQIEASDEEEAAPAKGKQSKKSKKSNKVSGKSSKVKDSGRGKRKAGESANLFINVASSILAEDYGQEIGDDEEEGEYEPPSQVSSESFPAASDSNMVSEEFQIGEQASAAAPLAHDDDDGEDFAKSKIQQSQKSQKPASKKKSEKQVQSQKSLKTSKAGSKEKILNQSLSQNVEEMTRGRQSRSKLSQRSQKEQTASLVATRKPTPRRSTRGAPEEVEKVAKKDLKATARSSSRKQSQEAKAPAETEKKLKMKAQNKQNFFIQRLSRRNKTQESTEKQKVSEKSTPRSKSGKKNAAGQKSKEKDLGKRTPRSTRGRAGREADQESEDNAGAPSTQKVEQISDVITDAAVIKSLKKAAKQQPAVEKPQRQQSKKKDKGQKSIEESFSKPSTNLKTDSRKKSRGDVVMAEPVLEKQTGKNKKEIEK